MLKLLSRLVLRGWAIIIFAWVAVFGVFQFVAPDWESVVSQGEFAFLPDDAASQVAQRKLEEAFPGIDYGSSLLFLVERESDKLEEEDFEFIDQQLIPLAEEVAKQSSQEMVAGVISPSLPLVGDLLQSSSQRAALALVQLKPEFLHEDVWAYINDLQPKVQELAADQAPDGLNVYLSGSAVLGRDITRYRTLSANWIQDYAVWLVVVLLLAVFRAPLIALIPLITLTIAVKISMVLLSWMAQAGWITLFDGIEVYLTVIAYGAGVDYSMFLISRFQEELRQHPTVKAATQNSVQHTGMAIIASACTEILGIAMLFFATYGKLSQSGIAISFALCIMLFASMTLTPSLLRVGKRWAFWPVRPEFKGHEPDDDTHTNRVQNFWERVGKFVVKRPWKLLLGTLSVLAIPAAFGIYKFEDASYGLFSELPPQSTSVTSLRALKKHFPLGTFAPVTVLIENPDVDFNAPSSEKMLAEWTQNLLSRKEELNIADVQNFAEPLGVNEEPPDFAMTPIMQFLEQELESFQAAGFFVAQSGELAGHITWASVTLSIEPFSREGIAFLDTLQTELRRELPAELRENSKIYLSGPTASLRSLQEVADDDQARLFTLVTAMVFIVLLVLLRKWLVAIYLVATVGLTFTITMGVTWAVFRLWFGDAFVGIDWTVHLLLFTLLMAVGADYNVLLVSRSEEEIERRGLEKGIVKALSSTGAVITGCGIVMAGTFATLLIGGRLVSMQQLGFALAFAMLLDTFVIRSLLVPAFLLLRGRQLKAGKQD